MGRAFPNHTALYVAAAALLPEGAAQAQNGLSVISGFASPVNAPTSDPASASRPLPPARALLDAARGEDLLPGNSTRLGYVLTHGNVIASSVTVTVNGARLSPGTGYTLEAATGTLTMAQPVRVDQAIVVRYRYLPASAAAPGGKGTAAIPLLSFQGSAFNGGSLGFALGLTRTDDGVTASPLLGLRTETSSDSGTGLAGLLYLATGSMGTQARSLLPGAPGQKTSGGKTAGGHLIDQKLTLGGSKSRLALSFQDVSAGFKNFSALRGAKAASEADLARLEKERGIQRLGLTGNVGIGGSGMLRFSHSNLTAGKDGITRQNLSLKSNGLSFSANYLSVDSAFSRFADLADADKDALAKLKGAKKRDMAAKWTLGRTFQMEGSLLDLTQNKNSQKNSRLLFSLTPGRSLSLTALSETAKKTENGKTSEVSTRAYDFATDPKAAASLLYSSKLVTTVAVDGKEKSENLTRFGGAALLGRRNGGGFGLSLRGLRETLAVNETDKGKTTATDSATTILGLKTNASGPFRLNLESKSAVTRRDGAPERRHDIFVSDAALQFSRSALASYAFSSDTAAQGEARTESSKESWALALGRGYRYRQSLDRTAVRDAKGKKTEKRTEFASFATDPAGPLFASGERRAVLGDKKASEVTEKWSGGLGLGGLSLRTEGLEIRRAQMGALKSEKNYSLLGKVALMAGWKAAYTAFDRTDRDPKTKLERDEIGSELTINGSAGLFQIALKNLDYDNRLDVSAERARQEITVTPTRFLALGPLQKGAITFAFGSDKIKAGVRNEETAGDGAAGGKTHSLTFEGLIGAQRVALDYADGLTAEGLPTLSKGIRFTSDSRRHLLVSGLYRMKRVVTPKGAESLLMRAWNVNYRIVRGHKITYSFLSNPEKPDGSIEKRQAESVAYVAGFGDGGMLSAEYRTAKDEAKDTTTRTTAFSLVSPASSVTAYEVSYLNEAVLAGDKLCGTETYILAYQFQPEGGATQVELAARWIERTGDTVTPKDAPDEAQANIEIKTAW